MKRKLLRDVMNHEVDNISSSSSILNLYGTFDLMTFVVIY